MPFFPHHVLIVTLTLLMMVDGGAAPASAPNLQDQQKNLASIRSRIESLRKELNSSETARKKAQQEAEHLAIEAQKLQVELNEIGKKREGLEGRLGDLRRQSEDLSAHIAIQQAQLERTLYHQYVLGEPSPLQRIMNGTDPSQTDREQYYLRLLAKSRKTIVADFRKDLLEKQRITTGVQEKNRELKVLLLQQQDKQNELTRQRNRHQDLIVALSGKVKKQKQQMGTLQQDEKRLTLLLDRLAQQIAARHAKEQKEAAAKMGHGRKASPIDTVPPSGTTLPLTGLLTNLRLPVQGQLAGRFGAARTDGGTWKGLLILTARGTPVKAIANGRVVFADWMRGFGNLLVLDHGDGYLSIYGYNDSLYRKQGESVKNGETIAAVGASGSEGETGLYFEIRHKGRPLDPLKWASAR